MARGTQSGGCRRARLASAWLGGGGGAQPAEPAPGGDRGGGARVGEVALAMARGGGRRGVLGRAGALVGGQAAVRPPLLGSLVDLGRGWGS